jgi:hypothetical protein
LCRKMIDPLQAVFAKKFSLRLVTQKIDASPGCFMRSVP